MRSAPLTLLLLLLPPLLPSGLGAENKSSTSVPDSAQTTKTPEDKGSSSIQSPEVSQQPSAATDNTPTGTSPPQDSSTPPSLTPGSKQERNSSTVTGGTTSIATTGAGITTVNTPPKATSVLTVASSKMPDILEKQTSSTELSSAVTTETLQGTTSNASNSLTSLGYTTTSQTSTSTLPLTRLATTSQGITPVGSPVNSSTQSTVVPSGDKTTDSPKGSMTVTSGVIPESTTPALFTSLSSTSIVPGASTLLSSTGSDLTISENSTFSPTSPYSYHHQPSVSTTSGAETFESIPNKITCQTSSPTKETLLILKMTNFSFCGGVKDSRNHPLYTTLCRAGKANFNKDRDLCHVQLYPQPEKQEVAVISVAIQTYLQPKELFEVLKKRWDEVKELEVSNMTYGKESLDKEVEDRFSMPLIITIVCMAAFLLLVAALYGCFHQRFSQRKDQQRLTEELQTVENGYHDNPTLEVMETSSEMQEKKVANLNGELGDSWIVPLDNLTKEDLDQEEEDTHL